MAVGIAGRPGELVLKVRNQGLAHVIILHQKMEASIV